MQGFPWTKQPKHTSLQELNEPKYMRLFCKCSPNEEHSVSDLRDVRTREEAQGGELVLVLSSGTRCNWGPILAGWKETRTAVARRG